jgi:hypothetical protein
VELDHSVEASSFSATQYPEFYQMQGIYLYTEASRVKSISQTKGPLQHPDDIAEL